MSFNNFQKKWGSGYLSPFLLRIVSGTFWSMIGSVIYRGLMFTASVCVARLLGTKAFGEFGIIQSTIGLFGIFAGFSLGVTTTKFVAEYRQVNPEKAGRIIALSTIIAVITAGIMSLSLFFFASYLAAKVLNAPHLSSLLQIGSVFLFFSAFSGLQLGSLAGFEDFKSIAKVNLITGLISCPLIFISTYFFGLVGAVWGLAGNTMVNSLLNYWALKKTAQKANVPLSFSGCGKEVSIIWKFCIPGVIGGMVAAPATWVCSAVLVNQSNGYVEMGIYNAVTKFQMIVSYVGSILGSALLPILSSQDAKNNEIFNRSNIIISWVLGLCAALPLICVPEIVEWIFGNQFKGDQVQKTTILVMAFTCVILYRQGLTRSIIANGMMWWGLLDNVLWACILGVSFFFLKNLGAMGLASSFLIAYIVNTIIFVPFYSWKALVPLGTMLSKEAFAIWGILAAAACMSYAGYPLVFRIVDMVISFFLFFFFFRRMIKKPVNVFV